MLGNWLKTTVLMAGVVVLFGTIGRILGGPQGMVLALLVAAAMNFWAYYFSDSMVLRMYDAQPADAGNAPQLYRIVQELSQRAGLPMPKVYVIDQDQPNAFATGRNPEHAAVCATTGIMRILSERELRGVMAHELAHVRHRDILISTVSATLAGAITMIAQFGFLFRSSRDQEGRGGGIADLLVVLLAPLAATLIQLAISRSREFEADRGGAEISGDPEALAAALDKIHRRAQGLPLVPAEQHPETAQMMIVNPLSANGLQGLFSTHPDVGERIARLHTLAHRVA